MLGISSVKITPSITTKAIVKIVQVDNVMEKSFISSNKSSCSLKPWSSLNTSMNLLVLKSNRITSKI